MARMIGLVSILAIVIAGLVMVSPARADHGEAADATPDAGTHGGERSGMSGTGAAYLVIANASDEADVLIGVTTEVAGVVEIHEIVDVSGVMQMRPLADGLEIPAGGEVTLEPGGYHVMLIGLTESLAPDTTYELVLEFEQAGEVIVPIVVQGQAPEVDAAETVTANGLTITGAWSRPAPMLSEDTPAGTPMATPGA